MTSSLLLGFDIGSSAVKANLTDADSGKTVASVTVPESEMEIISRQPGWAEQDPAAWWTSLTEATRRVIHKAGARPSSIAAIGISYQMHGLVVVDKQQRALRPSIIWCDSRAVGIGEKSFGELGPDYCFTHLLNSPGNFTASKLIWVRDNEPAVYSKIHKVMLPGDFIAMKMTGEVTTTASGLSEGMMYDYETQTTALELFNHLGMDRSLIADIVPAFGVQGKLTTQAAGELGLGPGIPICYRAGDQPNNAFSLHALQPGEVAATAGTSGVIYAVVDKLVADRQQRVNTFLHVNDKHDARRLGVLLCVNGTGSMYRWLRQELLGGKFSYEELNVLAEKSPVGAEGLTVLPFGNGAERMLGNRDLGASFHGLDLVRHMTPHVCRAVQEGIVFALGYGFGTLRQLGIVPRVIRAGQANMFQSEVFCQTFAEVTGAELQLFNTDGAQGAARGAGIGAGIYTGIEEAFLSLQQVRSYSPGTWKLKDAAGRWNEALQKQLS